MWRTKKSFWIDMLSSLGPILWMVVLWSLSMLGWKTRIRLSGHLRDGCHGGRNKLSMKKLMNFWKWVQSLVRLARSILRLWLLSRRERAGCALISESSLSMLRIVIIRCHVFESCWKGYMAWISSRPWIWQEAITNYLWRVQVGDCSLSQLRKGSMNCVAFHLELWWDQWYSKRGLPKLWKGWIELRLGIYRRYHRHHEGRLWEPLGGSAASVGTTA